MNENETKEYIDTLKKYEKNLDKRILNQPLEKICNFNYKPLNQYDTKALKRINEDIQKDAIVTFMSIDDIIDFEDSIEESKEYLFDKDELDKQYNELYSYFFDKYIRNILINEMKKNNII